DTKKHHSCHQPSGLRGTNHQYTKVLDPTPCHLRADNTNISWGEEGNRKWMKWNEAKRKFFADWLFLAHNKVNFNNLMCWFFQELHVKIAETRNFVKASKGDLQRYNCINLDYYQIINDLIVEIG
ncbi:3277_t:CDS:1, partial [Cetraspora pellucida]